MIKTHKFQINFSKLRDFIRNPTITPLEKTITVDLLLYAGVNGEAFPSEKQLARDLGYSDRHIRTQLILLKKKHILTWRKIGYSKSNKYHFAEELYFQNDNNSENYSPSQLGTAFPTQQGNMIPPKESQESNQSNSSQELLLFEKISNAVINNSDRRRFIQLCDMYPKGWVEDALKEISTRKLSYVKVGLISNLLEDWKRDGKPTQKPEFNACNKCENGYFMKEDKAIVCTCRITYEETLKEWYEQNKYPHITNQEVLHLRGT